MKIETVELRRISIPMIAPFRVSFGVEHQRDILLVRVVAGDAEGWGNAWPCPGRSIPPSTRTEPRTSSAVTCCRGSSRPATSPPPRSARSSAPSTATAWRRPRSRPPSSTPSCAATASRWPLPRRGARPRRVRCVGRHRLDDRRPARGGVGGYLAEGYRRIKLKIEPGQGLGTVPAVRDAFGDDSSCRSMPTPRTTPPAPHELRRLDEFNLLLIEQPFVEEDIAGHAALAATMSTPICLDESIVSAAVGRRRRAAGRVQHRQHQGRPGRRLHRGASRIHDVCAALGAPVWCGGMLETGVGRAANLALAALPNFTLPGDTSASDRYFAEDITEPFVLRDGRLEVPHGTGPRCGTDPGDPRGAHDLRHGRAAGLHRFTKRRDLAAGTAARAPGARRRS